MERKLAILIGSFAAIVALGCFVGYAIDTQVHYSELQIYCEVTNTGNTSGNANLYLVEENTTLNFTHMQVTGISSNIPNITTARGSNVTLPNLTVKGGETVVITFSGIGIDSGLEREIQGELQFVPPIVIGTNDPDNVTVTTIGRLFASTPFGFVPWEGYVIYSNPSVQGDSDARAVSGFFNIVLFGTFAAIVWGVLYTVKTKSRRFPFVTLAIFSACLITYIYVGGGPEVNALPQLQILRDIPIPFIYHAGFNHLTGNIPPFLIASILLESWIVQRDWKKFAVLYLIPLALASVWSLFYSGWFYYLVVSGTPGGFAYGLSTFIGTSMAALWVYLCFNWRELQSRYFPILSALSGVAITGVFFGWIYVLLEFPVDVPWDISEGIFHVSIIVIAGLVTLLILLRQRERDSQSLELYPLEAFDR